MKRHTRTVTRRRGVPLTAQNFMAPCYQPWWWYILNLINGLLGKDPEPPLYLC